MLCRLIPHIFLQEPVKNSFITALLLIDRHHSSSRFIPFIRVSASTKLTQSRTKKPKML